MKSPLWQNSEEDEGPLCLLPHHPTSVDLFGAQQGSFPTAGLITKPPNLLSDPSSSHVRLPLCLPSFPSSSRLFMSDFSISNRKSCLSYFGCLLQPNALDWIDYKQQKHADHSSGGWMGILDGGVSEPGVQ